MLDPDDSDSNVYRVRRFRFHHRVLRWTPLGKNEVKPNLLGQLCAACGGTGRKLDPLKVRRELRSRRESAGWSVTQLAGKIGVSVSAISHFEDGTRPWPVKRAEQVMALLARSCP